LQNAYLIRLIYPDKKYNVKILGQIYVAIRFIYVLDMIIGNIHYNTMKNLKAEALRFGFII